MGIVFTMLGGFVKRIFGSWQTLLVLLVAGVGLMIFLNVRNLEKKLADAQQTLKIEQTNNQTLRNSVATLQSINDSNQQVIDQVKTDRDSAVASVTALSGQITKTNQSLNDLRSKINAITTPPVKLSPYIAEAINGVQAQYTLGDKK